MADKEFKTPQDALAHFGRKGMKWGVRNEAKSKGGTRSSAPKPKEDEDAAKKASDAFYAKKSAAELQAEGKKKKEAQVNDDGFPTKGAAKEAKRASKADKIESEASKMDADISTLQKEHDSLGDGAWNSFKQRQIAGEIKLQANLQADLRKKAGQVREGKLTDSQKKLIVFGGIAAIAVAGTYGHYQYQRQAQLKKAGITSSMKKDLHAENKTKTTDEWNALFGEDPGFISATGVSSASGPGFYAGLTSKKAWDRPEFTIPEDTIFQRLSNHPENAEDYGEVKGAYATFLHNDKKLYGGGFEFGAKKYTVNFTAPGGTRVPSHTTALAHLKQVLQKETPDVTITDDYVASSYHQMAGGMWANSTSQSLFGSLRQFGYGAIVDDMDAGYLGDLPVVFFGKSNVATSTPRTTTDHTRDGVGVLKLTGKYA